MRRKTLYKAKYVIKVDGIKPSLNKSWIVNNPHIKIKTTSVFDNRTGEFWTEEQINERGIKFFLNISDLKETLNWNLNGNSNKYQFKWLKSGKETTEGIAFVFE